MLSSSRRRKKSGKPWRGVAQWVKEPQDHLRVSYLSLHRVLHYSVSSERPRVTVMMLYFELD